VLGHEALVAEVVHVGDRAVTDLDGHVGELDVGHMPLAAEVDAPVAGADEAVGDARGLAAGEEQAGAVGRLTVEQCPVPLAVGRRELGDYRTLRNGGRGPGGGGSFPRPVAASGQQGCRRADQRGEGRRGGR
jgi:hypothetical protein